MRYILLVLISSLIFIPNTFAWTMTTTTEGFGRTALVPSVGVCLTSEANSSPCDNAISSGVPDAARSKPTIYLSKNSSLAVLNNSMGAGLEFTTPLGAQVDNGIVNVCIHIASDHRIAGVVLKADDVVIRQWHSREMGASVGTCAGGNLYSVPVGALENLKLMATPLSDSECSLSCFHGNPTAVFAYIDSLQLNLSSKKGSIILSEERLLTSGRGNGFIGGDTENRRRACYRLTFTASGGGLFGYQIVSGLQTLADVNLPTRGDYAPGVKGTVRQKVCFDTELLGRDGIHPISAIIKDGGSNISVPISSVKTDMTAPTGGLKSQRGALSPVLTFVFTDGKGSGVQTVKFTSNGKAILANNKTWKITRKGNTFTIKALKKLPKNKRYRIGYTAYDHARHQASGEVTIRVSSAKASSPRVNVNRVRKGMRPVVTIKVVSKQKLRSHRFTVNGKVVNTKNKHWRLTRKGNQFTLQARMPMKTRAYRIQWNIVDRKGQRAQGRYILRNVIAKNKKT